MVKNICFNIRIIIALSVRNDNRPGGSSDDGGFSKPPVRLESVSCILFFFLHN